MLPKSKEIIYLSAPYSHPEESVREERLYLVNVVVREMLTQGLLVYSPLTHNIPIKKMGFRGGFEAWKKLDLAMLERCNTLTVLKIPGWEISRGVQEEITHAKSLNMPIEEMEIEPFVKLIQKEKQVAHPSR
jgi:hypothetical protein